MTEYEFEIRRDGRLATIVRHEEMAHAVALRDLYANAWRAIGGTVTVSQMVERPEVTTLNGHPGIPSLLHR